MKKLITSLISLLCAGAAYAEDIVVTQLTESLYEVAAGDKLVVNPGAAATLNSVSTTVSGEGSVSFGKNGTNNDFGASMTLNVESSFSNGQYRIGGSKVLTVNKTLSADSGIFQLLDANAKIIFNAGATINRINGYGGGQFYVNNGTVSITNGANIAGNASKFVVANGGVLNMNTSGGATTKYSYFGNCDFIFGWKDNTGITLDIQNGGVANIGVANSVKNNLGLHAQGIVKVQGTLNVANALRMFQGSTLIMDGGTLNTNTFVKSGSDYVANVTPTSDFHIANFYAATSGGSDYKFNDSTTTVNLKVVNTSTLGTIHMHDTTGLSVTGTEKGTSLIIDFAELANGATLTVKDFDGISEDLVSRIVTLKDYVDGALIVETELAKNADDTLIGIFSSDGNALYQLADGSITAIPEPAEWAGILGALAIAFAFMRRQPRK